MDNKKRLIDAGRLYDYISDVFTEFGHDVMTVKDALEAVESAPTVNAVELPCIAMIERSIKDGKMNPKHSEQKFNGRYAVVYIDKSKWNTPLIDICGDIPYNTEEAEKALKEREEND